jgi:ketosteroid isomerase-like protein
MSRAKAPLASTADDIEQQFYEAMQAGDIERLMAVWSDDDDIVCVHPGGGRSVGPAAIRAAFASIFANGSVQVRPEQIQRLNTLSTSVHSVVERVQVMTADGLQHGYVLATNVYLKSAEGWRLVAHHASPGAIEQTLVVSSQGPEPTDVLH